MVIFGDRSEEHTRGVMASIGALDTVAMATS
jgi:hypothetical protein